MGINRLEIVELISKYSKCKIVDENTRINALNFDSLHFVEIIIFIENKYGILFQAEGMVLSKYNNIKEFIDYIERTINRK